MPEPGVRGVRLPPASAGGGVIVGPDWWNPREEPARFSPWPLPFDRKWLGKLPDARTYDRPWVYMAELPKIDLAFAPEDKYPDTALVVRREFVREQAWWANPELRALAVAVFWRQVK
jgi:hypothetical protein